LALEAFRKAQLANPSDPAAWSGIGDCYAAMGRFDLAQSNYEAALAFSPHDRTLLLALATLFEREGQTARAIQVRMEANKAQEAAPALARAVQPIQPAPSPSGPVADAERMVERPVASVGSITLKLPEPRPADHMTGTTAAAGLPHLDSAPLQPSVTVALPSVRPTLKPVAQTPAVAKAAVALPAQIATSAPGPTAIALATPARPAVVPSDPVAHAALSLPAQSAPALQTTAVAHTLLALPAEPRRLPPQRSDPPAQAALVERAGPRLERLSRGEVALVTTGKPIWRVSADTRAASESAVRWVALAPSRPNVQVLNAARIKGIAASARTVLSNRGWRRIDIGDAPSAQRTSVVLYSKNRATLGRSLAAQFGIKARMVQQDILLVVLGRDAAQRIAAQRRS
jgi:tetratricopeptide (TPR) repeat protein